MKRPSFSLVLLLAFGLGVSAVGCPCVRGPVNASESLRWWLFSNFGASAMCPEILKRGVPIKMSTMGPSSVGRFFPQTCSVQVQDQTRSVVILMSGTGYAYVPMAKRVGFFAGLQMEFRPDFRMESDSLYVWGRFSRMLSAPNLQLLGVENTLVNLATQTPAGNLATLLGQGIVESEIARGFTVVHEDDGNDFAVGILTPPQKPPRPFTAHSDRVRLEADTAEIHSSSRAYIGPFFVNASGAALFAKLRVQGAPLVYSVVEKSVGDAWLQSYQRGEALGAPPGPIVSQGDMPVGEATRTIPVRPGAYYLVLENRAVSLSSLIPLPIGDTVSYATYGVEVGDSP